MTLRLTLAVAAASIATLAAAGANATVISGPTSVSEMGDDTSFDVKFGSLGAGPASLSFVLDGYASLDGHNGYEDDFTLSLNGLVIAKGTWNLGGGGYDQVYVSLPGATFDNVSGNGTDITWAGGHVNIATPLSLQPHSNTLTFAYNALEGDGLAGWQPLSDEGWGAHDIVVTQSLEQNPTVGVPEPATWGLMLVGFGGLGAMMRRQRALQPALAAI